MSVKGKRRFPSVIEAAISEKSEIKEITADTIRSDAAAILEALVAEFDEQAILLAMNNQGFAGKAYLSTLRSLIEVAQKRRPDRLAGAMNSAAT